MDIYEAPQGRVQVKRDIFHKVGGDKRRKGQSFLFVVHLNGDSRGQNFINAVLEVLPCGFRIQAAKLERAHGGVGRKASIKPLCPKKPPSAQNKHRDEDTHREHDDELFLASRRGRRKGLMRHTSIELDNRNRTILSHFFYSYGQDTAFENRVHGLRIHAGGKDNRARETAPVAFLHMCFAFDFPASVIALSADGKRVLCQVDIQILCGHARDGGTDDDFILRLHYVNRKFPFLEGQPVRTVECTSGSLHSQVILLYLYYLVPAFVWSIPIQR